MMIHRTHVVTADVCAVMVLTLGVGWFALGQDTNTVPGLPVGMETPNIRDLRLIKEIQDLAVRVNALESTVGRLEGELNETKSELNGIKTKSNK